MVDMSTEPGLTLPADVQLRQMGRADADAMLVGALPPGAQIADGYPTELSTGVAAGVGDDAAVGPFFVERRSDGLVVGEIGGARVDADVVEIGYAVADSCQGRGVATAAVRALLDRLRAMDGIALVVAHTPLDRPASARVLQKTGFADVGEREDEHDGELVRVTRWELALGDAPRVASRPPLMILVAGPYRGGTGDDPALIAANHRRIRAACLELFRAGHLAVNGEDLALPLAALAGSTEVGDAAFDEIFHPMGRRLVAHCDAVLRLPGASAGSDEMVALARANGAAVYTDLADVPPAT